MCLQPSAFPVHHGAFSPLLSLPQDLRDDPDEMLRGVDWGKVARFVDLSDELQLFEGPSSSGPGGTGGGGGRAAGEGTGRSAPSAWGSRQAQEMDGSLQQQQQPDGASAAAAQEGDELRQPAAAGGAGAMALHQEELFEAAGWAAPSFSAKGSARSRRAEALADMGWVYASICIRGWLGF